MAHARTSVGPTTVTNLSALNLLAESLLDHAERLTTNLELAGVGPALHIINIAGRQRMLSQRMAKDVILSALVDETTAEKVSFLFDTNEETFVEALIYVKAMPPRTFGRPFGKRSGRRSRAKVGDRLQIAALSEVLLGHFDRLTDQYERGVQILPE